MPLSTQDTISFKHAITGYLVGNLWWPNAEAHQPVSITVREDETLREACIRATGCGDFRGGAGDLADAVLETTIIVERGGRSYKRTRMRPLDRFASVADMIRADWPGPALDEAEAD